MAHGSESQRRIYGGALLLASLLLLYLLRGALTPVLVALGLAYLLDPLVDRLEAWHVPRAAGIAVLLVVGMVLGVLIGLLVLPAIVRDVAALLGALPEAVGALIERLVPWLAAHDVVLPKSGAETIASVQEHARQFAPTAVGLGKSALQALLGGTVSALGVLAALVIVPVLTFYLLRDFDIMVAAMVAFVPARERDMVVSVGREIDAVLSQFVRGQLMVMAILAALYALGYALVGVRLAVPIGLCAGMLSFIPYVGGGLSLGLASLMVALHWQGGLQLLAVIGVYACVQMLEGFVITPRIVGDKLGLPAVFVLLALMVFGELFGFFGIMLALPAAAVIKVFTTHALVRYRNSALFAGDAAVNVEAAGLEIEHAALPRIRRRRRLVWRLRSAARREQAPQ